MSIRYFTGHLWQPCHRRPDEFYGAASIRCHRSIIIPCICQVADDMCDYLTPNQRHVSGGGRIQEFPKQHVEPRSSGVESLEAASGRFCSSLACIASGGGCGFGCLLDLFSIRWSQVSTANAPASRHRPSSSALTAPSATSATRRKRQAEVPEKGSGVDKGMFHC